MLQNLLQRHSGQYKTRLGHTFFKPSSLLFIFVFPLWTFSFFRSLFTKSVLYCLVSFYHDSSFFQNTLDPFLSTLTTYLKFQLLCHIFSSGTSEKLFSTSDWWRLLPVAVLWHSLIVVLNLVLVMCLRFLLRMSVTLFQDRVLLLCVWFIPESWSLSKQLFGQL